MESVQLGGTALRVSRIGLGCEPLGGTDWGKFDLDSNMQAVSACLERGINVFDTADVYGLGKSEERLSSALGDARRNAIIISKCGLRWEASSGGQRAKTVRDGSAAHVTRAVENSLRRLRLDAIPLYLVHWPDPNVSIAETVEALDRCQRAGKIRYLGVSNFSPDQLRQANRSAPIAVAELPYNLLERDAETELLPLCHRLGIAVVAYSPLAQGLLTGKYDAGKQFDADDRRQRLPNFQRDRLEKNLKTVQRLREVGQRRGRSPAQVALRWVLDQRLVTCSIAGAKSPRQVGENLGALGWNLEAGERAFLNGETESL